MPDGQVTELPICAIHIVQYLDPAGNTCFAVSRDGDRDNTNMSTWIGLLELAKDSLLREYNGERP